MMDFILKYWRIILEAIFLLVSFVLFMIRKRPVKVVDGATDWLLKMIPVVINGAEATDFKGDAKLNYVIETLKDVADKTGVIRADFFDFYISFIKDYVEIILSTPQKKGVNTNE